MHSSTGEQVSGTTYRVACILVNQSIASITSNYLQTLLTSGARRRLLDGQGRLPSGPSARASPPHPTFSWVPRRTNTVRPRHVSRANHRVCAVNMSPARTRFPRSDLSDQSSQASAFDLDIPSLPLQIGSSRSPKQRLPASPPSSLLLGNNGRVMDHLEHGSGFRLDQLIRGCDQNQREWTDCQLVFFISHEPAHLKKVCYDERCISNVIVYWHQPSTCWQPPQARFSDQARRSQRRLIPSHSDTLTSFN